MDAVFLSDLHLKSLEERNGQTLLRFFRSLEERPGKPPDLFLLGDIFDLWVGDHQVFLDRYRPWLDILKSLSDRGARIVYFEGNHDLHLAHYWKEVLKAEIYVRPALFEVSGLKIRCEHGDEINQNDKAYLRLRAFLRHPVMEWVAHSLPGGWLDAFGQRWSKHSRKRSSAERKAREERIRRMIRIHAEECWEQDRFDAIISGHMHVRDDWSFERQGRTVRAINLGSWFEPPQVLILKMGQFQWQALDVSV